MTTVLDGFTRAEVIAVLVADGHMPHDAEIVDAPTLPSDKDWAAWRIKDGAVVVDATVKDVSR